MKHPITGFEIEPLATFKFNHKTNVSHYRVLSSYEIANRTGGNLPISDQHNS